MSISAPSAAVGTTTSPVTVGQGPLSIAEVVAVARHDARIVLDPAALDAVAASRTIIDGLAADPAAHYGISTGFGALATTYIESDRRAQLQASLVRSHAAGSGAEVEREVVRSLMLLRLSTLMTGRTGVRRETAETYAAILNAGITPVVREYGSLGCSGDLAPLAHCALVAMGEGEIRASESSLRKAAAINQASSTTEIPPATTSAAAGASDDHVRMPAASALAAAGITPLQLGEKEGLALINGTDGMLGMLSLAIHDLTALLQTADIAASMSVEGLMGTDAVFAADLHKLRPQAGQALAAANFRAILAGSPIVASHAGPEDQRVQDAYSLRCAPIVHGAARDTVAHATNVALAELASAVDNPVLTLDGRVESNGNFHGAPVGYVLDFLAIAAAAVASMSERRTDRFLDRSRNQGLPPFLAHEVGVDSGLMIAQYTAAGIVSEMKRLAAPASVDSIPSSAMQEDHVSMGWAAARKLRRSIDGLGRVLAIELLTAARGLALRAPLRPGTATGAVMRIVNEASGGPGQDRYLSPEIEAVVELVQSGRVLATASAETGELA